MRVSFLTKKKEETNQEPKLIAQLKILPRNELEAINKEELDDTQPFILLPSNQRQWQ